MNHFSQKPVLTGVPFEWPPTNRRGGGVGLHPKFVPLLNKVIPMHVVTPATAQNKTYRTEAEVRAMCAERGIPFEMLLGLAKPVRRPMIDVAPKAKGEKPYVDPFPNLPRPGIFWRMATDNVQNLSHK